MPFLELPMHPWCSGRDYCNADGRWKIATIGRPPPYWWLITLSDIDNDTLGMNGDWAVRPNWNELGWEANVGWSPVFPWLGESQLFLSWYRTVGFPGLRHIEVNIRYGNSEGERQIWSSHDLEVVSSWPDEFDDIELTKIYDPPTWTRGDPKCRIRIGTYDRMPANSCRGDYGGEFP